MNKFIVLISLLIVVVAGASGIWFFKDNLIPQAQKELYYKSEKQNIEPKIIKIDNIFEDSTKLAIKLDDNCYCLYNGVSEDERNSAIKTENWKEDEKNTCSCQNVVSGDATGGNQIDINSIGDICALHPYSVTYKMIGNINVTLSCKGNLKRCDYSMAPQGEQSIAATEYMIDGNITMCTNSGNEPMCVTGIKISSCQTYFDRLLSSDIDAPLADAQVNIKYYIGKNIKPIGLKNVIGIQTKCYPFSGGLVTQQFESCFNSTGVLLYSGAVDGSTTAMEATAYTENIDEGLFTIPNVKTFDQSKRPGL